MSGDQGKLKEIVEFRKSGKYDFRLFVDDAHGFGTLGEKGQGAGEFQGVQDEIDVLFGTFAKSMASVGAFVCSTEDVYKLFGIQYEIANICQISSNAVSHWGVEKIRIIKGQRTKR